MLLHGDRTAARTAAAMRSRERLVQIDVHHVDAEIAGPRDAHQRVHVRAIHVNHGAFVVQNLGGLHDVLFEHAQRIRIGHHQRRDVFIHMAAQLFEIDHALIVRLHVLHRVARNACRGGIGAVRGIGHQNLLARIALRFEKRAHQQDAGEFAMRARGGLQRDGIETGDFAQAPLRASRSLPSRPATGSPADKDAPTQGLQAAPRPH